MEEAEIIRRPRRRLSGKAKNYIFVAILLAYPVLQFVLTWSFVNINSLLHAFQRGNNRTGTYEWCGLDQFVTIFRNLFQSTVTVPGIPWLNTYQVILLNSLLIGFVTLFISLPLAVLFAYFLSKKMPLANVFRVIFFLPNIIPIVALTFAYKAPWQYLGLGDLFAKWPSSEMMVILYCVWAGIGYNVILLSGAIGRIPKELFESAKIDHAGPWKELFKIVIPCIWPTIVTLVVLGMTNVLTLYLQPYLLTGDQGYAGTLALDIFNAAGPDAAPAQYCAAAAEGLLASATWAPLILLTRKAMTKKYEDVDY